MMSDIMKKINFIQPKFVLPAILFLPLLGLGWLMIDIFHTEMQYSGLRSEMKDRYGIVADSLDLEILDSTGIFTLEQEMMMLEQRHLADSLKESEGKAAPTKESEWKEWNTLEGAASNVKTGIRKALSFCADVIDHEAVPVYIKTDTPADSIN